VSNILISAMAIAVISSPSFVYAGTLAVLGDKLKSMFASGKIEDEQTLATAQTMPLFKAVVMDSTTTGGADTDSNSDKDSLQAVSGALRVSTEEIDFPTTDTVSVYEVKKGDTIQDVAKLFNVSVNTIMWANNLKSQVIAKGDTLVILPVTGIKHSVKKGDTIASIAKKYKADEQDIASYNGLAADVILSVGETVIVPDGELELALAPKPKMTKKSKPHLLNSYAFSAPSGFLIRPLVGGRKTQGLHGHNGVDIASSIGTPILAAADGQVILAKMGGYNGGYGNMIIIAHDKSIQTVYGHLLGISVTQGQTVSQGQVIGALGNSGKSTGPHLHFEVRGAKNPF
jgi:LysM repeat protein